MKQSLFCLLAVSLLGLSAGEAIAGPPKIAEVALDTGGLTLQPNLAFERAVLEVVRPDGQKDRKRFDADAPLHYDLVGEDGQPLPDGKYRYLLRLTSQQWRGARTQGGMFSVNGGRPARHHSTTGLQSGPASAEGKGRVSPLRAGTIGISAASGPTSNASYVNDALILYDTSTDGITFVSMESVYSGATYPGPYYFGFQNLANNYGLGQLAYVDPTLTFGTTSILTTPYGEVGVGTIPTPYTYLEVYGDARFVGDVAMGSSRALKTDFEPVEAGEILETLVELPLQKWRFRRGSKKAVHIGPFSEDFHAAFGLGADDEHLSPTDTAGVAFAAIQGLHAEVGSLRRKNALLGWVAGLAMLFALAAPVVVLRLGR